MHQLSARQLEVLNYLNHYRRAHYCSPAYREIADHFGWASLQSASNHLQALKKKGYVAPVVSATGILRGYRVTFRGQLARRGVSAPHKGHEKTWDKGDTNCV
jgi:SOS-response transcriptional repressor LexA